MASEAPTATSVVMVGVGVPTTDDGCSLGKVGLATWAGAGPDLLFPQTIKDAGAYCLAVEDQFKQGPLTYTIRVWHS